MTAFVWVGLQGAESAAAAAPALDISAQAASAPRKRQLAGVI